MGGVHIISFRNALSDFLRFLSLLLRISRLNDESFEVDFYVLQLQGAEVVLGVRWLQLLGWIIMDYQQLYMEFFYNGKLIRLQGQPLLQAEEVESHQLLLLTHTESIAQCFQLFSLSASATAGHTSKRHQSHQHLALNRIRMFLRNPRACHPILLLITPFIYFLAPNQSMLSLIGMLTIKGPRSNGLLLKC